MAIALDLREVRKSYDRIMGREWYRGMDDLTKRLVAGSTTNQRYVALARAVYAKRAAKFKLEEHPDGDDLVYKTTCEVCLLKKLTLLVKYQGKGLISRDEEGDLVCGVCHPPVETALQVQALKELVLDE